MLIVCGYIPTLVDTHRVLDNMRLYVYLILQRGISEKAPIATKTDTAPLLKIKTRPGVNIACAQFYDDDTKILVHAKL
jgi:hypothetical protein